MKTSVPNRTHRIPKSWNLKIILRARAFIATPHLLLQVQRYSTSYKFRDKPRNLTIMLQGSKQNFCRNGLEISNFENCLLAKIHQKFTKNSSKTQIWNFQKWTFSKSLIFPQNTIIPSFKGPARLKICRRKQILKPIFRESHAQHNRLYFWDFRMWQPRVKSIS